MTRLQYTQAMHQEVEDAFKLFEQDKEPSERAKQVIEVFKSCFPEDCFDVVRSEVTRYETSTLTRIRSGQHTMDNLVDEIEKRNPYYDIIVKFPHETVTNEVGESTEVYDLFVKIPLLKNGSIAGYPRAKRSTFTFEQLYSHYAHSHVSFVALSEGGIKEWNSMCFGSGPIADTIVQLFDPSKPLDMWIGFISELRQWTKVESLAGGPYTKIRYIHGQYSIAKSSNIRAMYVSIYKKLLKSYIRSKRFKVGFVNGKFCLGTTFTEWLIDFSRYAIEWGKKNAYNIDTTDTIIKDNKILIPESSNTSRRNEVQRLVGKTVLTFKGKRVLLALKESDKPLEHMQLIPYNQGVRVVKFLLDTLNYYYGNNEAKDQAPPVFWG